MSPVPIDNDILFKGVCYKLLREFASAIPAEVSGVGFLGAARFVIRTKLNKTASHEFAEEAIAYFDSVLAQAVILEPNEEEIRIAAEVEFIAQREALNLDTGESQLCAIAINRSLRWLVTGDKRAIIAFEALRHHYDPVSHLTGKIICLEQLVRNLLCTQMASEIRAAICKQSHVDRTLAICLSCSERVENLQSWLQGLQSYIEDLRLSAKTVLAA